MPATDLLAKIDKLPFVEKGSGDGRSGRDGQEADDA
jgi:hypothetical protein